jgi:hypothetical protein
MARRVAEPPTARAGPGARARPWHAVGVVAGPSACEVARAFRGTRFLSHEAPHVPLPGCPDRGGCRCVYRHFADRRSGPRRAFEKGLPASRIVAAERRTKRGRRATDL